VDQYHTGHKVHVLISRPEVRNRDDIDEFNIEWAIHQGLPKQIRHWETHVCQDMKCL
jgi:hypothetical protein